MVESPAFPIQETDPPGPSFHPCPRDAFEGLFKTTAGDVNAYLTRSDFLAQLEKEPPTRTATLEAIYDALVKVRARINTHRSEHPPRETVWVQPIKTVCTE